MSEITGNTRVLGLLADPVHHVRAPQALNRLFQERGFDGVMVPLHVAAPQLRSAVEGLRAMQNLDGFVVTVPHKTAMVTLCDEVSSVAAMVGAVNVVRRTPEGRLVGDMLDGEGFIAGLRMEGLDPANRSVYLAGAGGAARAIAFALARAGVNRLTIANRTSEKVRELAGWLEAQYPELEIRVGTGNPAGHDMVVNGTSLGLRPEDELPLEAAALTPNQLVAEIIMQPAETPLLRVAKQKGCQIHLGAPMLSGQVELMARFMSGVCA